MLVVFAALLVGCGWSESSVRSSADSDRLAQVTDKVLIDAWAGSCRRYFSKDVLARAAERALVRAGWVGRNNVRRRRVKKLADTAMRMSPSDRKKGEMHLTPL